MAIEGSVFMTQNAQSVAYSEFSTVSKPMQVVKVHVEDALQHQGFDSNITLSYDFTFDTDDYNDSGKNLTDIRDSWRNDWLDGHSDCSDDFNLLLMNNNEWPNPGGNGGVGTIGDRQGYPRGAVLLGCNIIGHHDVASHRYGAVGDTVEGKIRGAIHEIGHNLELIHKDGLRYYNNMPGDNDVFATPMGCNAKTDWESSCSVSCTTANVDLWDHYFGDCEGGEIGTH